MENWLVLISISLVARLCWSRVAIFVLAETWIVFMIYYLYRIYGDWGSVGVYYHFALGMKNVIFALILFKVIKNFEVLKFGYSIAAFLQLSIYLIYQFVTVKTYYQIFLPLHNSYISISMIIAVIQLLGLIGGAANDRNTNVNFSFYWFINKFNTNYYSFTKSYHRVKKS